MLNLVTLKPSIKTEYKLSSVKVSLRTGCTCTAEEWISPRQMGFYQDSPGHQGEGGRFAWCVKDGWMDKREEGVGDRNMARIA